MRPRSYFIKRILRIFLYTFLSSAIYAYLTFYFVYPVVSAIPLSPYSVSLYLYILYSIIFAVMLGILIEEGEDAFTVLILSVFLGYVIANLYAGMPAYMYGYSLYTSDIQVLFFFSRSWILLFIYVIFGIIGIIIGGAIREYLEE